MLRPVLMALLLVLAGPATAHIFNHGDRHEACEIYGGPHDHAVDDGHAHWHHVDAAGAHFHGTDWFPAGHTHSNDKHDPCNQNGMAIPLFGDAVPLRESTGEALPDGWSRVHVMGESYDLPSTLEATMQIVARNDTQLDALDLPGSGTADDPYLIEGRWITGQLQLRDTSRCVIVRNNVVHPAAIIQPAPTADPMALLGGGVGQMILNWNGQCVHAYNNIVEDLRVNQNQNRTGFATGGIIEDNRIFHLGQLRHYDGWFRENEVGTRDLSALGTRVQRANVDGFNQGRLTENLFWGGVDLDFHGHHHGPGFFAQESHYHGSDLTVSYMRMPDGTFMRDAHGALITHHDHSKRWTSAAFLDNIVIDPFGNGLRYEDRNHQGDDRVAASESMEELNIPHFHRTWIRIDGNQVLGGVWIDMFNADGIPLWSDDYSPATAGAEPAQQAMHPGAIVVNSHPGRNDGWLDIRDNTVRHANVAFGPQAAFDIVLVKEVDILFEDNTGIRVPPGASLDAIADGLARIFEGEDFPFPEGGNNTGALLRSPLLGSTGVLLRQSHNSTFASCGNTMTGFLAPYREDRLVDFVLVPCGTDSWQATETSAPEETMQAATTDLVDTTVDVVFDTVNGLTQQVTRRLPGL